MPMLDVCEYLFRILKVLTLISEINEYLVNNKIKDSCFKSLVKISIKVININK